MLFVIFIVFITDHRKLPSAVCWFAPAEISSQHHRRTAVQRGQSAQWSFTPSTSVKEMWTLDDDSFCVAGGLLKCHHCHSEISGQSLCLRHQWTKTQVLEASKCLHMSEKKVFFFFQKQQQGWTQLWPLSCYFHFEVAVSLLWANDYNILHNHTKIQFQLPFLLKTSFSLHFTVFYQQSL